MRLACAWLCLWLGASGCAAPAMAADAACQMAAVAAEQAWALPARLLSTIGARESGRADDGGAHLVAWPWTINAAGRGIYAASKAEAMGIVRALQASGVRSIDVGCFQVNLAAHPDAFADLDAAFDPMANGAYAGRFLQSLRARTGSWEAAIGAYHSLTPGLGDPYRAAILAAWLGGAAETARVVFAPGVAVWGPTGRLGGAMRSATGLPAVLTPGQGGAG